jgi:hypothetical protein
MLVDIEKSSQINCQSSHLEYKKKSLHAPLDFCDGVTCNFSLRVASPLSPYAFDIAIGLRISLVCPYNSAIDFFFSYEVEESSTEFW